MKTFLYEQYGYYFDLDEEWSFEFENFKFKLIKVTLGEEEFVSMENHLKVIKEKFNNLGPHLIKNKYNKYISYLNNEGFALIAIYKKEMTFADLKLFHDLFFDYQNKIELKTLLSVWKNRVEAIEKNISSFLNSNDFFYLENMEKIMFYLGLATNAMQYVSDIMYDHGENVYGVCLSHKRLFSLNSFEFLNPMNFLVSSPYKDISMLYQRDLIDDKSLECLLSEYKVDPLGAKLLMARLLYRCDFFDVLEKKESLHTEIYNIEREISKIKKAYSLLRTKYQIRPIDWLEN